MDLLLSGPLCFVHAFLAGLGRRLRILLRNIFPRNLKLLEFLKTVISVPGITQVSLLVAAMGNQGIVAALNHNVGGIKDKFNHENSVDFSLR